MPKILTFNDPHSPLNNPLHKLKRWLLSLGRRKTLSLAVFTFALLMLPVVMVAVQQQTALKQHASSTQVVFVDQNNAEITQTTSPTVRVKLTSPYALAQSQNQPLAQGDTSDYQRVLGQATATYQVSSVSDDVNELNKNLEGSARTVWLGNSSSASTSYTGLRFTNVTIPKGATITSAHLAVNSDSTQWIGIKFQIAGDSVGNSQPFGGSLLPSSRFLTSQKVNHNSNVKWSASNWYTLDEMNGIVQEIVNRADWQTGNSLSLIMKGTGGSYGRKFVKSFESGASLAPKLLVSYTTSGTQPTIGVPTATNTPVPPIATPRPTNTPTPRPTNTPVPQATNTPIPPTSAPVTTVSITLAEDPNFTQNVQTISPVSGNPTYANYTFANSSAGTKLLFAKFTSSTGEEQVFSSSITLTQITQNPSPTGSSTPANGESMAMQAWKVGGKNAPNPLYDKCDDGTDIVAAHNQYYVIAYDGIKYPTWHPPVVTNPITGVGKCYFGHEHGSDPQKYIHWDEIYKHFGKDMNGDGVITPLVINAQTGAITPGDRAGVPFGIANEHMDMYYGQENRDSIFVRHEDHVGHKIEYVNQETDINTTIDGNVTASTHQMAQLPGTQGLNVPYYTSGSDTFQPTGVVCSHFHKFHQGTHSGDAVRNNLHEVIFHSTCESVDVNGINAPAYYPNNTVILTGMMAFGNPAEYVRFCYSDRATKVCPDGKNADGSCVKNDPLISKLPNSINSSSLGRNMVDRYCLDNWTTLNPGNNYFGPYELWEGDLAIYRGNTLTDSSRIAEHGRQWDVLDPIRFVDPTSSTGFSYNASQCAKGGAFDKIQFVGGCNSRTTNVPWDSPDSGFRGLKRTAYFGRNHIANAGGSDIYWTDPLGGNAVATQFSSGLKQRISTVNADIQKVQSRIQQLYGANNFLNDRAIQRAFNDGGHTVHAPN